MKPNQMPQEASQKPSSSSDSLGSMPCTNVEDPSVNSPGDSCAMDAALSTAAALAAASAQVEVKEASTTIQQEQHHHNAVQQPHRSLTGAPVPISFFPQVMAYQQSPLPLTNKNHQVPPVFQSMKLRRGKWTQEEERFADHLIQEFEKGTVHGCENGCTLRAFLSRKLHCAPMRISKKYAGKGIGKHVFLSRCCPSNHAKESTNNLDNGTKLRDLEMNFYKALFNDDATQIHCTPDSRLVVWNASADGSLAQNAAPLAFGPPQGYSASYQGYHHHVGAPCMPVHAYGHPIQIGQTPHFLQFSAQGPILQLPPQQHHQQGMLSSCAAAPGLPVAVIVPSAQQLTVPGCTQQAPCNPVHFATNQERTHQRLHQAYMDVVNHASGTATTNTSGEPSGPTNQGPAHHVVKHREPLTTEPQIASCSVQNVCPTPVDAIPSTTNVMVTVSDHQSSSEKTMVQPETPKYQPKERQQPYEVPIVALSSMKGASSSAPSHLKQVSASPCYSQEAPEVPDFLSGFEKVAARARETRGESTIQFQWIADGFDLSVDVNATTPMNTAHEEAYSPNFTSRSFDDLHCHLGKGLSSPHPNDFYLNSADTYALFAQQSAHAVSQHSAYARSEQNGDGLPQLSLPSVVISRKALPQRYASGESKVVQPHSGFINAANLLAHTQAAKDSRVDMITFSTNAHDDEEEIGHSTYSGTEHRNMVSGSEQSHSDRWTEEEVGSTRGGSENNTISDHASNDSDSTTDEGPRNKKAKIDSTNQRVTEISLGRNE